MYHYDISLNFLSRKWNRSDSGVTWILDWDEGGGGSTWILCTLYFTSMSAYDFFSNKNYFAQCTLWGFSFELGSKAGLATELIDHLWDIRLWLPSETLGFCFKGSIDLCNKGLYVRWAHTLGGLFIYIYWPFDIAHLGSSIFLYVFYTYSKALHTLILLPICTLACLQLVDNFDVQTHFILFQKVR